MLRVRGHQERIDAEVVQEVLRAFRYREAEEADLEARFRGALLDRVELVVVQEAHQAGLRVEQGSRFFSLQRQRIVDDVALVDPVAGLLAAERVRIGDVGVVAGQIVIPVQDAVR